MRTWQRKGAGLLGLKLCIACGSSAPAPSPPVQTAPVAPQAAAPAAPADRDRLGTKIDAIVDEYFGERVADPYRWLEAGDSEEVMQWSLAQNERTRAHFAALSVQQAKVRVEVEKALSMGYVGLPQVGVQGKKRRFFFAKREGTQNQPSVYLREGTREQVVLDVSALSADGTSALDWWYASPSGRYLLWGRSEAGDENSVLYVRDVKRGVDLPGERIERTRHASVAFLPDESGFFYTRYPAPGSVPAGDEQYGRRVFLHKIGRSADADIEVFASAGDKTDTPSVTLSQDGRYLLVHVHQGWDKSSLHLWDRKQQREPAFACIAGCGDERVQYAGMFAKGQLYVRSNEGAPRYRLWRVAPGAAADRSAWRELIAEGEDALISAVVAHDKLYVTYMHNARSEVRVFSLDGKAEGAVPLPGLGTAHLTASDDGDDAFIGFASFAEPQRVLKIPAPVRSKQRTEEGAAQRPEEWAKISAESPQVVTEQYWARSKDGSKIPYFVVSARGLAAQRKPASVIQYGYGGFNINQSPRFSAAASSAVALGAVWVTAVLRGGGEFGEAWHRAGMLENKQNVFDDFYAVSRALVDERKLTSPERLAMMGGSNGGLLVAASAVQHPEMYRAGASLVPLTDMLRYQHFRIAKLWVPEYGSAENEAQYRTLRAYSPYHNLKPGARYPAMLFVTGEQDSRVDPMHARKMAAAMAAAQSEPARPVLLRVDAKAGHGAGKPTSKAIDELSDVLTFLLQQTAAL